MAMTSHVSAQADPILAAIERHRTAWSVHQLAPAAEAALDEALATLLRTACTSRWGALELLRHLRSFLDGEAEGYAVDCPHWRLAEARAADLTLFLGTRFPVATRHRHTPLTPPTTGDHLALA